MEVDQNLINFGERFTEWSRRSTSNTHENSKPPQVGRAERASGSFECPR
jgi:hypothetical protein